MVDPAPGKDGDEGKTAQPDVAGVLLDGHGIRHADVMNGGLKAEPEGDKAPEKSQDAVPNGRNENPGVGIASGCRAGGFSFGKNGSFTRGRVAQGGAGLPIGK